MRPSQGQAALAASIAVAVTVGLTAAYPQIDLPVYRMGGAAVLHGRDLYAQTAPGTGLPFTYPPFAALALTPLALVPVRVAQVMWCVANLAALIVLIDRSTARLRPDRTTAERRAATVLLLLPCLLLEPVRNNLILGQVNLVLGAMILVDLTPGRRRRGVLIGIAAAVKLTPLIFLIYLALSRRPWDAARAGATFLGCGLVGLVVLPAASRRYWTQLAFDPGRTGHLSFTSNQSLYGALARLTHHPVPTGPWCPLAALAVGAAGLAVAVRARRAGDDLLGDVACGLTAVLVSPVSWTHHWVWVVPALGLVATRHGRRGRAAAAAGWVVLVAAPVWWVPHTGDRELDQHGWQVLAGNVYLLLAAAFLIAAGCHQARARHRSGVGRTTAAAEP